MFPKATKLKYGRAPEEYCHGESLFSLLMWQIALSKGNSVSTLI